MCVFFIVIIITAMVINNCKKRSTPVPITDPLGRFFENPTYTDNSMYTDTDTSNNTNMMNHDYITSSNSDSNSDSDSDNNSNSDQKDMSQKDIEETNESSTDNDYLDIVYK